MHRSKRAFLRRTRGFGLNLSERARLFSYLKKYGVVTTTSILRGLEALGFDVKVEFPNCPCCRGIKDLVIYQRTPRSVVHQRSVLEFGWV